MYERIVSIRRTHYFFYETAISLALLVAINLIFLPGKPAFQGVNPSPYWIIILAISTRYGRSGALFAGSLTAAVFLAQHIALGGMDAIYDDLWILRYPILFILIGFMVGEVKTAFILREDYLTQRVQELQNENEKLLKENEIVKEAHRVLTAHVATRQNTITILNEITARLKSYDEETIYTGILESFRDNLGAEECSFYICEGENLRLTHSLGWKEYYRRPNTFPLGKGIVGIAAKTSHTVSVKDYVLKKRTQEEDPPDILGDSLLAIPVLGLENRLFGVASIEKLPLLKLTDTTIQTAKVVCELAASSLNNASAFRNMEERQIRDSRFDLFKHHYFLARVREEFLRSTNYMIPLSAMAFRWSKLKGLSDPLQAPLIHSVITVLKSRLRAFDVLALGPNEQIPLVILLATTSGPQAEDIKTKMIMHLNEYGLVNSITDEPIENTITVSAYNPHTMSSAEDLLHPLWI